MRAWPTVTAIVMLCASLNGEAQGYVRTVTFDMPRPPIGTDFGTSYYQEGLLAFTPIQAGELFGRMGGGRVDFPENGSGYLILLYGDSLAARSVNLSSPRFGLYSVDLSEFSTFYPVPKTVEFIGYLADGSIVTQSFTTDGVIDGTGPLADFETFYFSSAFSDIIRFEVSDYGYAMDNLRFFQGVPEPGVASLLLLGLPLFRRLRRRRVLPCLREPSLADETRLKSGFVSESWCQEIQTQ